MSQFEEWSSNINPCSWPEHIVRTSKSFSADPADVYACFADLRGSTDYQAFLDGNLFKGGTGPIRFRRDFYQLFCNAVRKAIWLRHGNGLPEDDLRVENFLMPTAIKLLGDGVMMVWEVPKSPDDANSRLAELIFDVVSLAQGYFAGMILKAHDGEMYPQKAKELTLAFGLAAGTAIRFNYGDKHAFDYVGSALNLAARLQGEARNGGIVIHKEFAPSSINTITYYLERGNERSVPVKGFKGKIDVWQYEDGLLPIMSLYRRTPLPRWEGICLASILPLVPDSLPMRATNGELKLRWQRGSDDAEQSSQLRLAVEMHTAWTAANSPNLSVTKLEEIVEKMKDSHCNLHDFRQFGREFHREIARQASLQDEGVQQLGLLFDETAESQVTRTTDGTRAAGAYKQIVLAEHDEILNAIKSRRARNAQELMGIHLTRRLEKMLRLGEKT